MIGFQSLKHFPGKSISILEISLHAAVGDPKTFPQPILFKTPAINLEKKVDFPTVQREKKIRQQEVEEIRANPSARAVRWGLNSELLWLNNKTCFIDHYKRESEDEGSQIICYS